MSPKPKKNKRSKTAFPGLNRNVNLKIRWDELDQDYIDKLSDKEKEFLSKFNQEYVNADFRHEKPLMKSKKARRQSYSRNNARNRCIFSLAKAKNSLDEIDYNAMEKSSGDVESALIDYIDHKKSK